MFKFASVRNLMLIFLCALNNVNCGLKENGTVFNGTTESVTKNGTSVVSRESIYNRNATKPSVGSTKNGTLNSIAPMYPSKQCKDNFRDINNINSIDLKEYCKGKHCIAKCCKQKERIIYVSKAKTICLDVATVRRITNKPINIDYAAEKVFKRNIEAKVEHSNNITLEDYALFLNWKLIPKHCLEIMSIGTKYRLLENNSLVLENPNYYNRFVKYWDVGDFCFEHLVQHTAEGIFGPVLIFRVLAKQKTEVDDDSPYNSTRDTLKCIALLTSCFFLLLMLGVYGLIRELRNIGGMVLMAYASTLAVTFFIKAVEVLAVNNNVMFSDTCKSTTVVLYFTILSSFFWMTAMSFDIWWTFRGIFKCRSIHRQGELVKFGWYALYSWGVPLLVTIPVAVIDYTDLSHLPHIYKPHFESCFFVSDTIVEIRHYLYMPLLALLICDCFFFLMTAFNIWRIRKSMAQFANDANKYSNNRNRFGLYMKLSLVMGISWVLEVIKLPWWMEDAATAYNCLTGVAIFFIFIFKRKILAMLCKRFSVKNKYVNSLHKRSSKYSTSTGVTYNEDRKRSDAIELTNTADVY